MGCAASPIKTSLFLCHVGIGARNRSGHCLISFAFLADYQRFFGVFIRCTNLKTARTEGWKSEYLSNITDTSTGVCQSHRS